MRRHVSRLIVLVALSFALLAVAPARAQDPGPLCFRDVPGIGSCISERFQEYWQENGGLPIFGYPLTSEFQQRTSEGTFTVQYFERQRFESHPENARPYDVLLGRLGDEMLRRQGRDWRNEPVPPSIPGDVCRRFEVTRHIVCGDFLPYWFNHGLRLDRNPRTSYAESLALFGYPLTEMQIERNPDGFRVDTQWFERARFEYYPDNPDPFKVLLGRLGAEALNGVESFFGGDSIGHNAAARRLLLESQRDGSVVTVIYTNTTAIRCSDGSTPPPNILDLPSLKASAAGTYDSRGVLTAHTITVLCS